jgi:hypothetical protein
MSSQPSPSSTRRHTPPTPHHDNTVAFKKTMLFKKPDYYWSLDQRNPHLPHFLCQVEAGIKASALEYQLVLHAEDLQWLHDTHGDYEFFSPPDTRFVREKATRISRSNPSLLQMSEESQWNVFVDQCLKNEHTVLLPSPRFQGKAPNYQRNCERFCRQFWWYLAMIGDYTSMMLLLKHPPGQESCPSMKLDSIYGFTQHRYNLPHSPLKDSNEDTVLDISGRPMESEGSVLAPTWLDTFFAAMGILHDTHGQNGSYIPQCDPCNHNFKGSFSNPLLSHKPCTHHQTQRYCHTGNPTSSMKIKQLRKWLKGESVDRGYQVSKKSPFFPSDLVEMHRYVHSRNFELYDLTCYTMLLNAVETAMRFDGFQEAKFEHFERHHDLWQVHQNRVHSLAQAVKEKNDRQWYIYEHTFRDCMPKQCFLRHLLVLIHCLDTSSGFLYPAQEFIVSRHAQQGLLYSDFSKWLQDRLKDIIINNFITL